MPHAPAEKRSYGVHNYVSSAPPHAIFRAFLNRLGPMADPFNIALASIPLLEILREVSGSLKDYRRAPEQIDHALLLRKILESDNTQSSNISSTQLQEALATARKSLSEISESFPSVLHSDTRKFRLWWATGGKRKYEQSLSRLKEIESAFTFPVELKLLEQLQQIESTLLKIYERVCSYKVEEKPQRNTRSEGSLALASSRQRRTPTLNALVHKFDNWMVNYLGLDVSIIVSRDERRNVYSAYFRWPLKGVWILNWSLTSSWPTWPQPTIRSKFRVQNIVPADSEIVKTCSLRIDDSSLIKIRELFSSGKVHPNDTTPDNLTLMRFAVRGGNRELIKTLLEFGADPDLTFGTWETPLDNAFYCGRPGIVRELLAAKADLEYINHRGWTPIPYMWDPVASNPHTIELLDICAEKSFDLWESQDLLGWTPLHRAAAFGHGKDIKKLTNVMGGQASWNMVTLDLKWRPLHCAVRYGNLSALNVLVNNVTPCDWLGLVDLRGWTPLHLAAQSGSEEVILKLFEAGADPSILSDASGISVPQGLENQELTPQMIAQQCGYQDIYEKARKATGC